MPATCRRAAGHAGLARAGEHPGNLVDRRFGMGRLRLRGRGVRRSVGRGRGKGGHRRDRSHRGRPDARARRAGRLQPGARAARGCARTTPRLGAHALRARRALSRRPHARARRDGARGLDGQLRRHAGAPLPPRRRRAVAGARALAQPARRRKAHAAARASARVRGRAGRFARGLRHARRALVAARGLAGSGSAGPGARTGRAVERFRGDGAPSRRVRCHRPAARAPARAGATRRDARCGHRVPPRRPVVRSRARRLERTTGAGSLFIRCTRRARMAAIDARALRRRAQGERRTGLGDGPRDPARPLVVRDARSERRRAPQRSPVPTPGVERTGDGALACAARRDDRAGR